MDGGADANAESADDAAQGAMATAAAMMGRSKASMVRGGAWAVAVR